MKYQCVSVPGGWQTQTESGQLIGPVLNRAPDLWKWQAENLNTKPTPPDPDNFNVERTASADALVQQFMTDEPNHGVTDREDALADILTNLMHWCDRCEFDFNTELERARRNYTSETTPEPSTEQLEAVEAFRHKWGAKNRLAKHGLANWKDALCWAWAVGCDEKEPHGALLRQVRNEFGPDWLANY